RSSSPGSAMAWIALIAASIDNSIPLILKPILHLHRQHLRRRIMRPAEGVAIVEQVLLVGDIGAHEAHGERLAKVLAHGKIKSMVGRKMVRTIAVDEP